MTTIVPFQDRSKLPECAAKCKALYDANANCVPPIIAAGPVSNYEACFCVNQFVAPLSTATDAVCNDVCSSEKGGQASVASWFGSLCHVTAAPKSSSKGGVSSSTSSAGYNGAGITNGGRQQGPWISNHWQWVIMLVVLVVAIAGIWVGACIWRRRYLRRKDRQTSLGQKQSGSASRPSWGPNDMPNNGVAQPQMAYQNNPDAAYPSFQSAEKPASKKKWRVSSRT